MKRTFLRSAVLSLSLALFACGGEIEPGMRAVERPLVQGLTLAAVAEVPLAAGESYVGTVESRDRGLVAARTDGMVARIAVREGEEVKGGALLLTVTGNQAQDRLGEAQAGVAGAKRRLAASRARSGLASKTFERYRRLFQKEVITPQEMDRARAELEEARQGVAAAEAAVEAAVAGQGAARTAAGYSRVVAPFDGKIARLEVEEGSTVMPGTPLLVLDRAGGKRVRVRIPESRLGKVAVDDTVQVEIPSRGETFPARISAVEPAADPGSRSFEAKADLPPEADLPSGLFARVILPGPEHPALLVPASALVERGQLTGVYVARDGILSYRLVRTGRKVGDRFEVLSGLRAGETVVAEGVERARSGARVEG